MGKVDVAIKRLKEFEPEKGGVFVRKVRYIVAAFCELCFGAEVVFEVCTFCFC